MSLSKIFICLVFLATVKGGSLLLLGGISGEMLQELAPVAESEGEDILVALQAMRDAVKQSTAEAAEAEKAKEQSSSKEAVEAGETSYTDQLQVLKRRRQELDRQEADLKVLQANLEIKITELKKLEVSVKKMLDEADVTKDKKVAHLVSVYANMKPQQAAQVLETLEDKLAVKILAGMDGRTAGKILSYAKAERAAVLSEQLTKLQIPFTE